MTTPLPLARAMAVVLVAVGVAGCFSASPPTSYLLSAATPAASSGALGGPVVGVGPVTIPAYLDRSAIVVRGPGEEVGISAGHNWAEPLGDAVSRVLAENLSAMIPTDAVAIFPWRTPWTPQYRVTLDIFRFDGPLAGPAILSARWRLLDGSGKTLVLKAVNLREALTEPTHAGLVAAQGRLLATLSRDIAAEISTLAR